MKRTTVLAELQARPEGPPSRGSLSMTRSGKPWARPTAPAGRGAEPVLQLLPQAVVDADGLLQALAQVPDLAKMLLQQVSPCSHPTRTGETWHGEPQL